MGYVEANKGPVGFYTDFVWAKLGFTNSTASYRNPITGLKLSTTTTTALTYSMTIVEAGGSTIARWPGSPGSFTAVDAAWEPLCTQLRRRLDHGNTTRHSANWSRIIDGSD